MPALRNITGQRFGKLTAVRIVGRRAGKALWHCECECGNTALVPVTYLTMRDTKSCGCRKGSPLPVGQAARNAAFLQYKKNAKTRNLCFDLTTEEFYTLSRQNCFYCGSIPKAYKPRGRMNGPFIGNGIDRLHNNRGYDRDNCVPCCQLCNWAKGDLSLSEFMSWLKAIATHQTETVQKVKAIVAG